MLKYNFLSFESKDSNWASLENEFLSIQIRCNDKKAYDLIGWEPKVNFSAGLKKTIEFVSDNLDTFKTEFYNI